MQIDPLMTFILVIVGPSICFGAGALLTAILAFFVETAYAPKKLQFIEEFEGKSALCASGTITGFLVTLLFIADDYAMSVSGFLWLIASLILAFALAAQFASAKWRKQRVEASRFAPDHLGALSTAELLTLAKRKSK